MCKQHYTNIFVSFQRLLFCGKWRHLFVAISRWNRLYSSISGDCRVAIIGSGPAAFYTAQQLLKLNNTLLVDMYERMPVPFGLIRYGVAPDHPDVKNVINTFNQVANNSRVKFIGNVSIGQDVELSTLCQSYSAVVLAYGSSKAKTLDIPGEKDNKNVISARDFVGWYNGYPDNSNLEVDLSGDTAVVVGNGNVALDVARILLSPVDKLKSTDTPENVLTKLANSNIRQVRIVGRRGPLQAAFTIKELRELTKLDGVSVCIAPQDVQCISSDVLATLTRPKRRLAELILKSSGKNVVDNNKGLFFDFYRSPTKFIASDDCLEALEVVANVPDPSDPSKITSSGQLSRLDCSLAIISVGYANVAIDPNLPLLSGVVANQAGRVVLPSSSNHNLRNVYCSGWLKSGPTGVILNTMSDSFETAQTIVADFESGKLGDACSQCLDNILLELVRKGVKFTSFSDWVRINDQETADGQKLGKPREKILKLEEFFKVAWSSSKPS